MTITLAAGASGLLLGCLAALIWLAISMRLGQTDFWTSCRRMTLTLLSTVDARDFRVQYGQLLILLGRYLARNLLLTAGASLPVILFVVFVAPSATSDGSWLSALTAMLPMSGGHDPILWSWGNGPEVTFCTGLSLSSSAGVFLLPKGLR